MFSFFKLQILKQNQKIDSNKIFNAGEIVLLFNPKSYTKFIKKKKYQNYI